MRTDGRADKHTDGQTDTVCDITLMFYVADVVSLSLSLSLCMYMYAILLLEFRRDAHLPS